MRQSGGSVRPRAGHGRPLRLGLLIGAVLVAGVSTLLTPAVASQQLASEDIGVQVYPGESKGPQWTYNYRGIRPDDPNGTEPLRNPQRGLRLELMFNAHDLKHANPAETSYVGRTVAEIVEEHEDDYGKGTKVTQLYFYLHEYIGTNISQAAIRNMQSVFTQLKDLGYTVVLRFAYQRVNDDPNGAKCTSTAEADKRYNYTKADILRHLGDLKQLLADNAGLITSWEAGFLGAWGEWGPNCTNIQKNGAEVNALMQAIVETAPSGVPVIMRYPQHRNYVNADMRDEIGFHNDYFAAGYVRNETGTGFNFDLYNPQRPLWSEVVAASPDVMVDGEMAYSGAYSQASECPRAPLATSNYDNNKGLDPILAAQRLQSMHYTTFSETHNHVTFGCWNDQSLTQAEVAGAGLPSDSTYFQNATETRSAFEYIRDHLGYRLRLTDATFAPKPRRALDVKLNIVNDGFSAPHIPRDAYLVLLDEAGVKVREQVLYERTDDNALAVAKWTKWQGACSTEHQVNGVWTTRKAPCTKPTHALEATLDLTGLRGGRYSVGLWLPDAHDGANSEHPNLKSDADYAVRLGNGDIDWSEQSGVNVIAKVLRPPTPLTP